MKQNTGKASTLRKAITPFLAEGHKEAPAARPISEGQAAACPWCRHSFPIESAHGDVPVTGSSAKAAGDVPVARPKPSERSDEQRALSQFAASVLMKILYVARTARFDLLPPACKLACYIACWVPVCDRQLLQLASCAHSSHEHRLTGMACSRRAMGAAHICGRGVCR